TGTLRRRRVLRASSSGRRIVYRLTTRAGRALFATAEHPLLTPHGWRPLAALREGEWVAAISRAAQATELFDKPVAWDSVMAVEHAGTAETFDLEIEGDHNFLANDLVVHNSHSSSFALLAYASAYLKAHHGPAFYTALLNNQPMGFYHSATVVNDARRHGVRVLPVDVTRSDWPCTLERRDDAWVVRLGLRVVKGLRERAGQALVTACATRVFASARDLAARVGLTREEMATLATIGALSPLGGTRRANLWTVAEQDPGPLFAASDEGSPEAYADPSRRSSEPPLREMSADERLTADYAGTGVTLGPHPMALRR